MILSEALTQQKHNLASQDYVFYFPHRLASQLDSLNMENSVSKSGNSGIKVLKIYTKYFKRFGYYVLLPEIRLSGKWLQNLGFNCGEHLTIISEKDRILIRNSNKIKITL